MTWFPDMGHEAMVESGDHVRAVGWLHGGHPFPRGKISPEFTEKLGRIVERRHHCVDELYWAAAGGYHTCELCGNARGTANLGVPAGDVLFVAPEMVLHYIEQHGYLPPEEFIAAVIASPLPGTSEYAAAVSGFRVIHQRQHDEMLKEPPEPAS